MENEVKGTPIAAVSFEQFTKTVQYFKQSAETLKARKRELEIMENCLKQYETEILPAMMQELGIKSAEIAGVGKISLGTEIACSVTKKNGARAFEWLASIDCDNIIKSVVEVQFGKGEIEQARTLEVELNARGFTANLSQSVHYQTLKALLKERLQQGQAVDFDAVNGYVVDKIILSDADC